MHVHTLRVTRPANISCEGCDVRLRLATYREAVAVREDGLWAEDGPMEFRTGIIVVPADFSVPVRA